MGILNLHFTQNEKDIVYEKLNSENMQYFSEFKTHWCNKTHPYFEEKVRVKKLNLYLKDFYFIEQKFSLAL